MESDDICVLAWALRFVLRGGGRESCKCHRRRNSASRESVDVFCPHDPTLFPLRERRPFLSTYEVVTHLGNKGRDACFLLTLQVKTKVKQGRAGRCLVRARPDSLKSIEIA